MSSRIRLPSSVLTVLTVLTVLCVVVLVLSACTGANIGLKTDFKNAGFEIGRTTRSEVIAHLGLPQKSIEDPDGRTRLLYEGGSRLTGLCVGCGNAAAPVGAVPYLVNDQIVKNGAEYVFDKSGILVRKTEPVGPGR